MLELRNLSKQLGNFNVCDINLEIKENEYIVILGPTGSGKTVLLELIAGIYSPCAGDILINEKSILDLTVDKRNIGMLYQEYMLFPHYTVRENIAYGLKIKKEKNINEKVEEICKSYGIIHILERYPDTLSGGEKQRTALARALICKPKIILLDEPFSALDIVTKEKLIKDMKNLHKKQATTFIHVTHDFEEAILLADKIALINKGRIVQFGYAEEIFKKPESEFVASFTGAKNIFYGEIIKDENDNCFAKVNGLKIYLAVQKQGKHNFLIHPQDIIISNEKISSSAKNNFQGKIINILFKQYICEVEVEIKGLVFTSFITKNSYERLNLKIEKNIFLTFKAMEVHVF